MKHHHTFMFVDAGGHGVPARRHINPDGTVGGWVASSSNVPASAHIAPGAVIGPNVQINEAQHVEDGVAIYEDGVFRLSHHTITAEKTETTLKAHTLNFP